MSATKLSYALTTNPSGAPKEEQVPAKIWELLRRNNSFHQTVRELHRLNGLAAKEPATGPRLAWNKARHFVVDQLKTHSFAACALEWLVPEPLFVVVEVALPTKSVTVGKAAAPLKVKRVGEGTTPDLKDTKHWRWFASNRAANLAGRRIVRGPEVRWQTSKDSRLADKCNAIEEYRQYDHKHGPFMTNDAWASAPPGFKCAFQRIWATVDGRMGTRPAHEVSFDVKFTDFVGDSSGGITQVALSTALKLRQLHKGYQLFAVPRDLMTKGAARAVFLKLAEEVAATLPNEHAMLGTPKQWDDFLAVEAVMKTKGCSRTPAIHQWLMENYAGKRTLTVVRQASEADVTARVAAIENLRDGIFPTLDWDVLLKPAVHRRSSKPRRS